MTRAEIDRRRAAALQQPGARERGDDVKFQCPQCRAEGHDQHKDNARVFANGKWGCAVDRAHFRAIGEVLGVYATNGARPGGAVDEEPESEPIPEPEAPYTFAPAFPPDHFVSRFVEYGSHCVDTAHEYLETTALVLLATATPGVRARLRQYPRGLPTAFYALLIGDSTRSRKSTVAGLGLDLLIDAVPDCRLAEQASPEAFLEQLASRKNDSSLWYLDEAGETFDKLHHAKYLAGLRGLLLELHAHRDADLYRVLTSSTGSRRQPLTFVITTASSDEHSIATEVYRYSLQVLAGVIEDPTWLAVIYGAPEDADPWSEATWRACNPALRSGFRSLDELRTAALQAKEVPAREPAFRQLYLNQWGTAAAARWLPLAAWDGGQGHFQWQEGASEQGAAISVSPRRAFLGLDLASTRDLTALAILLPTDDGYALRVECWVPEDTIPERERSDRVPYRLWADQGWLRVTPGNTTDYGFVEKRIHELMAELDVQEIGADPWNARDLVTRLQANAVPIFEVPQTMANLSAASKELERLILSGRLRHDGNPVMRWCVSNAVADVDSNGNVKPSKKRSHERIDGVSATVTALARALVHAGPSVYDTRGPLEIDF